MTGTVLLAISDELTRAGIIASLIAATVAVAGALIVLLRIGIAILSSSRFNVWAEREVGAEGFSHLCIRARADDQLRAQVTRVEGAIEATKPPTTPWPLYWRNDPTNQDVRNVSPHSIERADLASGVDASGFQVYSPFTRPSGWRLIFTEPASTFASGRQATLHLEVRSIRFHRSVFVRIAIRPGNQGNPPIIESHTLNWIERWTLTHSR